MGEPPQASNRSIRVGRFDPLPFMDGVEYRLRPGIPSWAQEQDHVAELSIRGSPRHKAGQKIRVLIADPQLMCAESLGYVLDQQPDFDVVPHFPATGSQTLSAVEEFTPDVALVELRMPDMDGPEIARTIHKRGMKTKVIVVSWYHAPRDIEAALDAGAVGFLTKGLTVSDVAEGIRRAQAGEAPVFQAELNELLGKLHVRADDASNALAQLRSLSRRELEVLTLLALDKSAKEVAEELTLAPATIRSYIRNMLKKTGALSTQEVLVKARICGLLRT